MKCHCSVIECHFFRFEMSHKVWKNSILYSCNLNKVSCPTRMYCQKKAIYFTIGLPGGEDPDANTTRVVKWRVSKRISWILTKSGTLLCHNSPSGRRRAVSSARVQIPDLVKIQLISCGTLHLTSFEYMVEKTHPKCYKKLKLVHFRDNLNTQQTRFS